jgi:uncharacterized membrane protein YphA (DoxX/SURF4 family)
MSIRGSKFQSMPINNPPDMAQASRPAVYGGGVGVSSQSTEKPLLKRLQEHAEEIDNWLGSVATPIKPFLPAIGRFLIVVTFLEDAWRIVSQWREQVHYIWNVQHIPYILAVLFLALNVVLMIGGSFLVVARKRLEYGIGGLLVVVISQAIVYGLIFNFQFFFNNLSLIGGLLLALSDAFVRDKRGLSLPGLPQIEDRDKSKYLQLAGRILMIFLFLAHLVSKKWSLIGGLFDLLGLVACVCVAVGFKARLSASFLSVVLTIQNFSLNPYWKFGAKNPTRDFLRYEHFRTLSIIGGLILLVSSGAGRISIDEKKKIY